MAPAPAAAGRAPLRRFLPVMFATPLLGVSLGVDGGPIFQILAIENLGISAAALGTAFGLGILSLPLQMWAARFPVTVARRNTQRFLVAVAVQAAVVAALVGTETTGAAASLALGITILAEISVSVLFATSWQPLLAASLGSVDRQRLASVGSAASRLAVAGAVVLFAALNPAGRAGFLVVVALGGVAAAWVIRTIPEPPDPAEDRDRSPGGTQLSSPTRRILTVLGLANFAALPLWLVYLADVLWPSANLGVVAGVQTLAGVAALLAWRSTDGDILPRAIAAIVVSAVVSLVIAVVPSADDTEWVGPVLIGATAMAGAATAITRMALLELAHRHVRAENSVRAFTLLDVVGSTSLQAGLFISGLLITVADDGDLPFDPYRAVLVVGAVAAVGAVIWLRSAARAG